MEDPEISRENGGHAIETITSVGVGDEETQHTTSSLAGFADGSLFSNGLPQTVASKDFNDTAMKAELLPEALIDAHWSSVDSMNRDLPTSNWANFSPIRCTPSDSIDTSSWAQTISEGNRGHPFITSNNSPVTVTCISKQESPGWQAFTVSRGSTTATDSWPEAAMTVRDSDSSVCADTTPHHVPTSDDRSNEPFPPPPHYQYHSCTTVFRKCFTASSPENTMECSSSRGGGGGGCTAQLVTTECTGEWQCLRDDR